MEKPIIAAKVPMISKTEPGDYYWCACGKSDTQPFCDGSHAGTSFEPVKVTIKEPKNVAWCMCKNTKNQPFCDGSHTKL
jgi:CDGSH-type Zn-finger protein